MRKLRNFSSTQGRTFTKRAALCVLLALAFTSACSTFRNTNNYRWFVKTLTDKDSAAIHYSNVRSSSVAEQTRFHTPILTEDSARQASEDSVYAVVAYLVALKTELDGDYHLILRDIACDSTMRAEIPNPDVRWTLPSSHSAQFRAARAAIDSFAGVPNGSQRQLSTPIKLRITGVGFFDPEHFMLSHEGEASNLREIHPVLAVERIP